MNAVNDNASRFIATPADVNRSGVEDDPLVWFAVQTNPNCEDKAARNLIAEGFVVYLPMETRWWRPTIRGKKGPQEAKSYPRMVGYLFVGMCRMQSFYVLRAAQGVRGLVGINGKPSPIPEVVIRWMQGREERGYYDDTRKIVGKHKEGDQIVIAEGAFTGHFGRVLEAICDGKLRIEIAGLFGGAKVEVDDDHVEARAAA